MEFRFLRSKAKNTRSGIRETIRLSWPLALSMLAGASYHICNRYFLAQCSDSALEAVLPAEMLSSVLYAVLVATLGYSGTLVAQFHGGGDHAGAVNAFVQGLWLTLFSVPLFLLALPVGHLVIETCEQTPSLRSAEWSYFAIVSPAGLIGVLNCVLSGRLTGQGKTRYVGLCTIVGTLTNMALNPILIFSLNLGLPGSAMATVVAQLTTTALLCFAIVRDPFVKASLSSCGLKLQLTTCGSILRGGIPLGLNSLVGTGAFTIYSFLISRCTPMELAVNNAVFAVNNIYYFIACATGQATTILTGRFYGAHKPKEIDTALKSGLCIVVAELLIVFAILIPSSNVIMDLFRGKSSSFPSQDFRLCGMHLLLIMLFREAAEGVLIVIRSAFIGIGETNHVMKVQCAVELFFRIPLNLLVATITTSAYALWLIMPIDVGITAAILYHRWLSLKVSASLNMQSAK